MFMHRIFKDKKGFIGMWADVFKGFIIGLILGIILTAVLIGLKIIPAISNMLCSCGAS